MTGDAMDYLQLAFDENGEVVDVELLTMRRMPRGTPVPKMATRLVSLPDAAPSTYDDVDTGPLGFTILGPLMEPRMPAKPR